MFNLQENGDDTMLEKSKIKVKQENKPLNQKMIKQS